MFQCRREASKHELGWDVHLDFSIRGGPRARPMTHFCKYSLLVGVYGVGFSGGSVLVGVYIPNEK
jgi:hypothetical protein